MQGEISHRVSPRETHTLHHMTEPAPLTPQQAAEYLGIKPAMLRRHAKTYERVTGEYLGTGARGARRFPREVLESLNAAMTAYRLGHAESVEEALRSPQKAEQGTVGGLTRPADVEALITAVSERVTSDATAAVRQELKALLHEVLEEREQQKKKRRGLWPWQ